MERICKGVYLIPGPKNGRFPFSNSVLILDRTRVLIDTGCGDETLARIEREYAPDLVFLSHAHPDHCSGTRQFPSSRVWVPREGRDSIGDLKRMAERFIIPPLREEWTDYMHRDLGFREFAASNTYGEGDTFFLGSQTLVPVYAPGHSDDHYVFHIPENGVMVTTDIDFTRFGPWYGNDEGDIHRFIQSVQKVRAFGMTTAVSSHEGILRDGLEERFDRFLSAFDRREERLLAVLDRPQTLDEIVDRAIIYGSFPVRARILRFWERQMIEKHLARLQEKGSVRISGDRYVRT
jgi:hydroxyacylglutathione hydrolase